MTIAELRGWIDFRLGRSRHFYPWGFAMNGMTARLEAVRQIIFALKIQRIIETGTFRGTTTEWFAQFGLPVETVEVIERYYAFSKCRLSRFHNGKQTLGNSTDFLKGRIASTPSDERQMFYLDAHWEAHLPLREEIELIFRNYTHSIAIIDDFEVPDDGGYGFDAYSEQDRICLTYLKKAVVSSELFYFFPRITASQETGWRRGWVVITNNAALANELDNIALLLRFHWKD
jgi:hypothetical protein